jgi:lipopolysaccharide/colanic/teichoic acid biosynthesis glycosyltransferase
MSAHPIAEPRFGDRSDVQPSVDAKKLHREDDSTGGRSPEAQLSASYASTLPGEVSEVNPWVISAVRSGLDRIVAGIILLILLPVMAVITAVVRLSSRGPALFCQRRAGRNREEFTLYKFRSMRVEDCEGPAITVSGDCRVTPVGAFLRRYKLDELPQFWNVLKGNMSLVGPRPKLPHHEGLDLPYRPGITGMATLAFRDEERLLASIPCEHLDAFYECCIKPRKARLDLEYMQNATLGSDLRLLWRTCASCLFGPDEVSLAESERLSGLVVAWLDPSGDLDDAVPFSSEASEVGVG